MLGLGTKDFKPAVVSVLNDIKEKYMLLMNEKKGNISREIETSRKTKTKSKQTKKLLKYSI